MQSPLEPFLEGIYDNKDGTYTAYLSYVNTTPTAIKLAIGNGEQQHNFFTPGELSKGQPTEFKPGTHRGVFHFTFGANESYTWSVQAPGYEKVSVFIDAKSPKLPPVEPSIDCRQPAAAGAENVITIGGATTMKGTFSYRNQNPFDIFLPVGQLNSFSPGKTDRGQPSQFFAGLNKAAFSAMVESGVTWSLPGTSSTLSEKTPQCACTTTSNETSKVEILTLSKELLELAYKAADTLDRASRQSMNKLDKEERNRLKDLLNRSGKRMIDTFAEIEVTLSTQIPKSSTACAELQADCRIVDDGPAIDSIRQRYDLIVSMINRLTTRAGFIEENDTRRYREMRKKAANIAEQAVTVLTQVPRFREVCGESSATVKMKVVPKPILRQKDKRASTK